MPPRNWHCFVLQKKYINAIFSLSRLYGHVKRVFLDYISTREKDNNVNSIRNTDYFIIIDRNAFDHNLICW